MLKNIKWKELKSFDWQLIYYEKKTFTDGSSQGRFHVSTLGIVLLGAFFIGLGIFIAII